MKRLYACGLVLLVVLGISLPARAQGLRVVASIKPIHALAARLMDGVGSPELLVKGAGSAHAYALRPSEADALASADVIFWIGPNFEVFLRGPLQGLGARARRVALAETPGLHLLPNRPAGLWTATTTSPGTDGHVWLDPGNAAILVAAMTDVLVAADAANGARYRANAQATIAGIEALDAEIEAALEPVRAKPFIVFHDATHAFESRYGLAALGAVTIHPERAPATGAVMAIRRELVQRKGLCVFAEPQFEPKLIQALTDGTTAKTGVLDPEGSALVPGPELYFDLMRGLAANMVGCLSAPS